MLDILKKLPIVRKFYAMHQKSLLRWYKGNGKQIVHFIHIGKTAGTAIKSSLNYKKLTIRDNYILVLQNHGFKLKDVPKDEYVFFIVRDPLSRFISGFYSRYRKGLPRIYSPWTAGEEMAFSEFQTPNELGEALSSLDSEKRKRAEIAMSSIGHVNTSYYTWFHSSEILRKNSDKIRFVGVQENLNEEFIRFKSIFGLDDSIQLPKDEVKSHKTPTDLDKFLNESAVVNLRKYYALDYEFLDILHELGLSSKKYN